MSKPVSSSSASSASENSPSAKSSQAGPSLNLRDPYLAALLAWLLPGAGHWYQRRRSKAVLYFLCIFGTFGYGLWLGEGRVVYAAWGPTNEDKRLPYFCQLGAGAVALPALFQATRFAEDDVRRAVFNRAAQGKASFWDTFMAPPNMKARGDHGDELDQLNYRLNRRFELGTVYTMVAGLLNLLVVFDAFGGPAYGVGKRKEDETPKPTDAPTVAAA